MINVAKYVALFQDNYASLIYIFYAYPVFKNNIMKLAIHRKAKKDIYDIR